MSDNQAPEVVEFEHTPTHQEIQSAFITLAALASTHNPPLSTIIAELDGMCPDCGEVHKLPVTLVIGVGEPLAPMIATSIEEMKNVMTMMGYEFGPEKQQHIMRDGTPVPEGRVGKA